MNVLDSIVFCGLVTFVSLFGVYWSNRSAKKSAKRDLLVGSNVSVLSVALSVCSSFLSSVSLLGFPAEVYYRGTLIFWYLPMYMISFPVVAYVFLPVFYDLKLTSIYEYLEMRFCFACRICASLTFIVQTVFYLSVALYAPSLALSTSLRVPMVTAILLTASLSAVYLYLGGARAGIYTSALQMALILISLFVIVAASLLYWSVPEIWQNAVDGLRLEIADFRLDPRVRHSAFPLLIGGSGTIFSLFATNQLTIQRYMALPNLKKAQRVVLLNIPMNATVLTLYTMLGVIVYGVFHGCHPRYFGAKDKLLPYFVETQLSWIPGLEGLFIAAVYSAGISTLTAAYNALTAVTLADVLRPLAKNSSVQFRDNSTEYLCLVRTLPFCFAVLATLLALLVERLDTMVLQVSLSIFGAAGGTVLGVFCLGLFCPWIISSTAALASQLMSLCVTILIVGGALLYKVKPVDLPLSSTCSANTTTTFEYSARFGTVESSNESAIWANVSKLSYQYYSIVGVCVCFFTAHVVQLTECYVLGVKERKTIDARLLATFLRPNVPSIVVDRVESVNAEMTLLQKREHK